MKKTLCIFFPLLLLFGCDNSITELVTYQINEPVFMARSEFRNSVKIKEAKEAITNYGKICFYDGYLYISEPEKGIHILDNRNPSNPVLAGYIEVPGNADLAIRNNQLYADSYVDLVWFDITNPVEPALKGRLEKVFPDAFPVIDNEYGFDYAMYESGKNDGVVIRWTLRERTEEITTYSGGGWWWFGRGDYVDSTAPTTSGGSGMSGINGSMSRFGLYDKYLYTVIRDYLNIFDVSGIEPKREGENIYIGWNVETIFSNKDNLFFGTPTGMLIYSVQNPLNPKFQSSIQHVFGCDPVVVENDIAYVTIHSGNNCGQNNNELIIINVSDVKNPKQIVSYTMTNPKGLGIDNGVLFVCDDGLKIYKADNPQTIMANQLKHYPEMDGFDVIPYNNILMMVANDGIYQYDYSDLNDIKQLSFFSIEK